MTPVPRGLSLVELLVGLAVGLLVLAGGLALLASHLQAHRSLLIEVRLMHELRTAAQAIARDLRRAGHWGDAAGGLVLGAEEAGPPRTNPYHALDPDTPGGGGLRLQYSRDAVENHQVDLNETFGLRLNRQVVETLLGGSWQALTDANHVQVTELRLVPSQTDASLAPCERPCPSTADAPPCPPRAARRRVDVTLQGRSALDGRVERGVSTSVLLRNDALTGRCPP